MKKAFLICLLSLLAACASITAPQSLDQRLAYVMSGITAVRQSCGDLLARQRLSRDNAQKCLVQTDAGRTAVDLARSATGRGDISTAQGQLQAAQTILTQLELMLKEAQ